MTGLVRHGVLQESFQDSAELLLLKVNWHLL